MKKCQGLFAIGVLLLYCLSLSLSYAVAEEICEQHPFLNNTDGFSQNFFYSYGRGWDFTAKNNLSISSVQAHSSLAGPNASTAHIQVKINDETIASWDQILTTTYTYYTHDALVNADLLPGDAITFFIYGGTSSTAGGAVRNADNYVKLCGTLWVAPPNYFINATAGSGGTIAPAGNVSVTAGTDITFNILPNDGYKILDVIVDGVSNGAVASYTFTNVSANHTILATFEAAPNITVGDLNGDNRDDLAVVTASEQVRYSINLTSWTAITGEFETIVCGDLNGDGNDDLAGVNSIGQVWYTTDLRSWTNIPGTVAAIVTGDLDGDGDDDIAGINPDGMISKIFYTTDLSNWTPIPGLITSIVTGDLDGDGDDDIAGINPDGMISKIFYTTDLSNWTPIPGLITLIITGDLDGDGDDDIAGINSKGMISKIFYTTDLSNWTPIPGLITSIVAGDLDGDGDDDIAGINPDGITAKIFYTTDLVNWNIIPGALDMITTGNFNADGRDDLAGVSSSGMTWYTTDLATWTNIP